MAGSGSCSGQPGKTLTLAILLAAFALCQVVYRPWSREPLDILDFSEFLLQMRWDANVWENWSQLVRYYAGQGRVNEVPYVLIAFTYGWFKVDPLGWQGLRAVQMLIVPVGVYLVVRRLGASSFGSVLGASLFLFGTAAASNWLRQTAEPIGTLFFLGATWLACGFSQGGSSWRRAAGLSLCVTGMLLSKETLVACIPFLVLIAACWESNGQVRPFQFNKATLQASAACGLALVVLALALAWAHTVRQPEPYAALYGSAPVGGNLWAGRMLPLILPVTVSGGARSLILFPANLVFAALVGTGLVLSTRWPKRHQVQRKLFIAATLPIAGLLVYLPWPRYELFYGLPFFLGTALWAAILLGHIGQDGRWRAGLSVCWLLVVAISAMTAAELAGYTRARREVNKAIAHEVSTRKQTDTVMVASARLAPQPWQNPAATLGRYALATRIARSLPVLIDATCSEVADPVGRWRKASAMYVYVGGCGDMGTPDRRIERPFSFFDWSSARARTEAFTVDVFDRPDRHGSSSRDRSKPETERRPSRSRPRQPQIQTTARLDASRTIHRP